MHRVFSTELLRALLSQTSALLNISVSRLLSTYSLGTDSRVDQPGCDGLMDPPHGSARLLTQLQAGRAPCKQETTSHCPTMGRQSSERTETPAVRRPPPCKRGEKKKREKNQLKSQKTTGKVLRLHRGWHDGSSTSHRPGSPAPTVIYELRGLAAAAPPSSQHTLPTGTTIFARVLLADPGPSGRSERHWGSGSPQGPPPRSPPAPRHVRTSLPPPSIASCKVGRAPASMERGGSAVPPGSQDGSIPAIHEAQPKPKNNVFIL